jgi:hypothetical protein
VTLQGGFAKGQLRDVVGVGSVINAEGHQGVSKAHKIEDIIINVEEKGLVKKKSIGEAPMNNPSFGTSPSEKKA